MQFLLLLLVFCFSLVEIKALQMGSFVSSDQSKTVFRVYATSAQKVELFLYASETGPVASVVPMKPYQGKTDSDLNHQVAKHTWEATVSGDVTGTWYKFRAVGNNGLDYQMVGQEVATRYRNAHAFLFHPEFGYMVDTTADGYKENPGTVLQRRTVGDQVHFSLKEGAFSDYALEVVPEGEFPNRVNDLAVSDPYCYQLNLENNRCQVVSFGKEFSLANRPAKPGLKKGHTIHEVHIKDLTYLLPGIPEGIRGTYKALSHPRTLKLLKDMFVTTIEFLPLHAFDRNAAPPGEINYWGYMTKSFFAMHEAYASEPLKSREEFRDAVDALHKIGVSVVLDVVYNHTSEGDHRGPVVSHKNLARDDYFRMWNAKKGFYLNTAGCGNVMASEKPVTRKLILDSLKFFYEVYGVDGFRFDLAAAIDKETLVLARKMLGEDALLSGEPWVAEGNPQWMRGDLNEIRLGKWNDQFRKAIKGGGGSPGFMNGEGNAEIMKILVRGEHSDFGGSGSYIDTSWGNSHPEGTINEIEVHDGPTLRDWLATYQLSESEIHARMRVAHTLLLTSVHTPILHFGQEFARTKNGHNNSYNQDNKINWIDYNLMKTNQSLNDFTVGLKRLRSHYDAFHFSNRIVDDRIWFFEARQNQSNAFAYKIKGTTHQFLVLVNGSVASGADFDLPEGVWDIVSDGQRLEDRGLGKVTNQHYFVHPSQAIILRQKI
ncbi:MAG: hypothetical protein H3C47_12765 [Candidatus Cloacimonetes bacterium]|nr:hypothetical protein [Candidatus Cloacimonadota bacterium]